MIRITEGQLKSIIEQVVGYKAPKKNPDDNTDYLQMGSSSVAAEPGSHAAIKADRDSAASLTKNRQDALDKGDLDTARTDAHQLQMTDDELQNEGYIMRITERKLRRLIREGLRKSLREMTISVTDAEQYLRDKADDYRSQGVDSSSMRMLLQDDFMDDLGHQHHMKDFQDIIDELTLDTPNPAGLSQEVEELSPPTKPSWAVRRRRDTPYYSRRGRQRQGGRGGFGGKAEW